MHLATSINQQQQERMGRTQTAQSDKAPQDGLREPASALQQQFHCDSSINGCYGFHHEEEHRSSRGFLVGEDPTNSDERNFYSTCS